MTLREWLEEHAARRGRVSALQVLERLDEEHPVSGRRRANGRVTIEAEDLLGAYEVAALLRVDRTRPSKWRINGTTFGPDKLPFPEPFSDLKTGPVWLRSQIVPLIPFVEERRRPHRD